MTRPRISERLARLIPDPGTGFSRFVPARIMLVRILLARILLASVLVGGLGLCVMPVSASEFWDNTYLIGISQGSSLTEEVDRLGVGGYELSDGTKISFKDWYGRQWTDVHVQMMTEVAQDFGVVWGLSSGESGEKYKIYPGLQLGLLWQIFQNGNSELSVSVTEVFGGNLVEYPCTANYGDIGGVQKVNCRMAASTLPPKDTLQYLVDLPSPYAGLLSLTYTIRF